MSSFQVNLQRNFLAEERRREEQKKKELKKTSQLSKALKSPKSTTRKYWVCNAIRSRK